MIKHRRSNVPRPSMMRGPWVAHPVTMIRVFLGLSLAARRILDVLEIEHCRHGRRDNGRLVCTYSNFEQGGVRRGSICGALRELVAVGLIEITRSGRRQGPEAKGNSAALNSVRGHCDDGGPCASVCSILRNLESDLAWTERKAVTSPAFSPSKFAKVGDFLS